MSFSRLSISAAELRLAVRLLRRQPVVTLTTVLALAVGIGMATTGFTLLDSVLFSKLPYPNGDRFVLVEVHTEPEAERSTVDAERFRFFRERASTFEHLGAFRDNEVNLLLPSGEVLPVPGALVTPSSIAVFPHAPIVGRMLTADDGVLGAPPVALIRESLWRRHFSADAAVVGSMAEMSGVRRMIVGVMPDDFKFPGSGEIWLPLSDTIERRTTFGVLRHADGVAAANAELSALSKQFETASPAAPRLRLAVLRFTDALSRGLELLSGVLVGALVLVLLVIAANIANLVLARTLARSRELAVSTALGATRGRLVSQIFCEVLLLGVVAAIIGLTASQAVLGWVRTTITDMPFWVDFTASPRTILFVVGATLLSAAVGGVVPALKATSRDMAATLAAGARGTSGAFGWASGLMIAVQVALSIALLNGALLMARGVTGYMSPNLPVEPSQVLTARVWTESSTPAAVADALAAIPGIIAAGAGSSLPGLSPAAVVTEVQPVGDQTPVPARPAPVVSVRATFFEALGAKESAGRLFGPADFSENAAPVAIVNEPFVRKFFGGRNPIGHRIRALVAERGTAPEPWREIVGVVPELGLSAGDETMAAGYYVPMQAEEVFDVALRTTGDARRLAGPLRSAIGAVDPTIQIREVRPLHEVGKEDRAVFAGIGAALAALGGMALLLSVIGTYAILSLSVTRRTREIGIRSALGATPPRILRTLMGKTALPPAIGAAAGIALGQGLVAARGIFAFRLPDSSGPWGLPLLGLLMIAAGLLAAWVPARRALRIEPADALRAE